MNLISANHNDTLNDMIRIMLNVDPKLFNLKIIKKIISHKFEISDGTLSNVFNQSIAYMSTLEKLERELAEKNIYDLVQLLIKNNAKISKSQMQSKVVSITFNFQNPKFPRMIIQQYPGPIKNYYHYHCRSHCYHENNTNLDRYCYNDVSNDFITRAIKSKNLESVKAACQIALQYDIQPDISQTSNNSLTNAVLTGNPEIVKELLMIGAKPNNNLYTFDTNTWMLSMHRSDRDETFASLYRESIDNNNCINIHTIEEILKIIICSGAKLTYRIIMKTMFKKNKNNIEKLILSYWLLKDPETRTKLKLTADELKIKSKQIDRRHEIEDVITSIPICCIDIIFEYQHDQRLHIIDNF